MIPKYLEQLERVRRMLRRIEDQYRPPEEYVDDMWSFFQNCWHLKDWVRNDEESIPKAARDSIVECADNSPILRISRDLANGSKHLRLYAPQVGAKYSHDSIEITPGSGKPARVRGIINIGSGNKQDCLNLARECLSEWERIIEAEGLKI